MAERLTKQKLNEAITKLNTRIDELSKLTPDELHDLFKNMWGDGVTFSGGTDAQQMAQIVKNDVYRIFNKLV